MRIDRLPTRDESASRSLDTSESRSASSTKLLSYLSLMNSSSSDITQVHRTQPFSRSSSTRGYRGSSVSLEYIQHPSNLLVRSNPIGLAEPKMKRDGYGSCSSINGSVQSIVHCFEQHMEQGVRERSDSVVSNGSRKISSIGNVRMGSGLIGSGKPAANCNFFRPFGNVDVKMAEVDCKPPTAPKRSLRGAKKTNSNRQEAINPDKNGEKNVEKNVITPFAAVDIMLASTKPQTRPRRRPPRRRRRSSTMTTTTTTTTSEMSETEVTVSLPPTRRASRQGSEEPQMSRCSSSTSVQIFTGVYTIKVPRKKHSSSEVLELAASFSTVELNDEELNTRMDNLDDMDDMDLKIAKALSKNTVSTTNDNQDLVDQHDIDDQKHVDEQVNKHVDEHVKEDNVVLEEQDVEKDVGLVADSKQDNMEIKEKSSMRSMDMDKQCMDMNKQSMLNKSIEEGVCNDKDEKELDEDGGANAMGAGAEVLLVDEKILDERSEVNSQKLDKPQSSVVSTVLTTDMVDEFRRRREHVYTHGWEENEQWFLQSDFRAWWQLNGCVGVPLYKIYRRKSQWRTEIIVDDHEDKHNQYSEKEREEKEDSVERILRRIKESRERREALLRRGDSYEDEERRSSESICNENNNHCEESNESNGERKRIRTFSETLKMLDEDIVADLNLQ